MDWAVWQQGPALEDGDLGAGAGGRVGRLSGELCLWLMKTCLSVYMRAWVL